MVKYLNIAWLDADYNSKKARQFIERNSNDVRHLHLNFSLLCTVQYMTLEPIWIESLDYSLYVLQEKHYLL